MQCHTRRAGPRRTLPVGSERTCGREAVDGVMPATGASMSGQVFWFVELAIQPGALGPFLRLTEEMIRASREEPGTLIYERALSSDGTLVIAHERYGSSDAALTHLRHFRETYSDRFDALVQRRTFTVIGHASDELRQVLTAIGARVLLPIAGFSRMYIARESHRKSLEDGLK
jgi:quinol monooxygenase YgiN